MSSGHHISMEHRLRRKHFLVNPDTNSSSGIYLKEYERKRKRKRKKRKTRREKRKRGLKGVPSETAQKFDYCTKKSSSN